MVTPVLGDLPGEGLRSSDRWRKVAKLGSDSAPRKSKTRRSDVDDEGLGDGHGAVKKKNNL